jgi:hypothetical protein
MGENDHGDNIVLLMAKAHHDERIDPRMREANPDATWAGLDGWWQRKEISAMDAALFALRQAGYDIVKRRR